MAQARSYTVVDTGQTLYYDNTKVISSPSSGSDFYGQDAQYVGNQPTYVDNGDGTVSDLNTGLTWTQAPTSDMSWADAVAYADAAEIDGYSDWRLPTIKELYSLINFSGNTGQDEASSTPFIDTSYFDFSYGDTTAGERMIDAQYWSSTVYVGTTMTDDATVFGVNFADGRIKGYPMDLMTAQVILVRGNTSYGQNDFFDNGDGTINDYATGLMWSTTDSGTGMDWQTALSYAESSTLAGYTDWRLPDAKELQSIVDYTQAPEATDPANIGPAIDDRYFTLTNVGTAADPDYGYYWTGTTHVEGGTGDYAVYLALGTAWGEMNGTVIDVHGAGAQRSDPKYDDGTWPTYWGPQGDLLTIDNYVLTVRAIDDDTTVSGGAAAESLSGLTGDDMIYGGGGNDTIDGNSGRDWVTLGDGGGTTSLSRVETLLGGAGSDLVQLGTLGGTLIMAAIESLTGGSGADWITLGDRGATVVLGAIETLLGGAGSDVVSLAGTGNTITMAAIETLVGGSGLDAITTGARGGSVTLTGVETLSGGSGADWVTLGSSGAVTISGVETLLGSGGADSVALAGGTSIIMAAIETLTGSAGGNWITLGDRGGTVFLSGVETILGGSGSDAVQLGNDGNTISMAAVETLIGGSGADSLTLGDRGNVVTLQGVESVLGGLAADVITLSGGTGTTVRFQSANTGGDSIFNFTRGTDHVAIEGTLRSAVDSDGSLAVTSRGSGQATAADELVVLTTTAGSLSDSGYAAFRTALGTIAGGAASTTLVLANDGASSGLYLVNDNGDGIVSSSEVSLLAVFSGVALTASDVLTG